jgi:RNA polymerase sigma factor (sigma-70 family)
MDDQQRQDWGSAMRRVRNVVFAYRDKFSHAEREDLAQEAAMAFWLFGERHQHERPAFAALRTIVKRTRWRAIGRNSREALLVAEHAPCVYPEIEGERFLKLEGGRVPMSWLIDRLRVEMAAMGEPCRRILHAFYQEGESCKEIAQRLGISQSVVKTRLHRSRVHLRKALEVHARAAGYFGE